MDQTAGLCVEDICISEDLVFFYINEDMAFDSSVKLKSMDVCVFTPRLILLVIQYRTSVYKDARSVLYLLFYKLEYLAFIQKFPGFVIHVWNLLFLFCYYLNEMFENMLFRFILYYTCIIHITMYVI